MNRPPGEKIYEKIRDQIAPLQIIVISMVMGIAVFAAVLFAIARPQDLFPPPDILNLVGLIAAAIAIPSSFIFGMVLEKEPGIGGISTLGKTAAEKNSVDALRENVLMAKLRSVTVIRCAILEGAAFMNLVICFALFNGWNMVAAAVLAACILWLFPTRGKVLNWLDRQSETAGV